MEIDKIHRLHLDNLTFDLCLRCSKEVQKYVVVRPIENMGSDKKAEVRKTK